MIFVFEDTQNSKGLGGIAPAREEVLFMKILIAILIIIGIVIGAAAIYIYSGSYNVAATQPHSKITLWLINEMREASIEHHSKGIKALST
ncbi:MAG: hypothetical protein ACXU9K_12775, partial [Thermodesulfobacteriota bacterium]